MINYRQARATFGRPWRASRRITGRAVRTLMLVSRHGAEKVEKWEGDSQINQLCPARIHFYLCDECKLVVVVVVMNQRYEKVAICSVCHSRT